MDNKVTEINNQKELNKYLEKRLGEIASLSCEANSSIMNMVIDNSLVKEMVEFQRLIFLSFLKANNLIKQLEYIDKDKECSDQYKIYNELMSTFQQIFNLKYYVDDNGMFTTKD